MTKTFPQPQETYKPQYPTLTPEKFIERMNSKAKMGEIAADITLHVIYTLQQLSEQQTKEAGAIQYDLLGTDKTYPNCLEKLKAWVTSLRLDGDALTEMPPVNFIERVVQCANAEHLAVASYAYMQKVMTDIAYRIGFYIQWSEPDTQDDNCMPFVDGELATTLQSEAEPAPRGFDAAEES